LEKHSIVKNPLNCFFQNKKLIKITRDEMSEAQCGVFVASARAKGFILFAFGAA